MTNLISHLDLACRERGFSWSIEYSESTDDYEGRVTEPGSDDPWIARVKKCGDLQRCVARLIEQIT